jgi:hypothetical protein
MLTQGSITLLGLGRGGAVHLLPKAGGDRH